jgi:hypothetical protein
MSRVKNLLVVLLFVTICAGSTSASSGSYINLNEVLEEMKMGKVKNWLMGMEEDASYMSLDEWTDKHGEWNKMVYESVNGEEEGRIFYDLFE